MWSAIVIVFITNIFHIISKISCFSDVTVNTDTHARNFLYQLHVHSDPFFSLSSRKKLHERTEVRTTHATLKLNKPSTVCCQIYATESITKVKIILRIIEKKIKNANVNFRLKMCVIQLNLCEIEMLNSQCGTRDAVEILYYYSLNYTEVEVK